MDNFDEIRFSRKSFEDAFGFECMKMAYKLKLKGRMDYGPDMKSVIRLQGESQDKNKFLDWVRSNIEESLDSLDYTNSDSKINYDEFDIYRHD
jgi:acylphosphatase